jgi:deoxyribose-phosphate aldolase
MDTQDILSLVDLTLLDHDAKEENLITVCDLADKHRTAAVCVYAEHADIVRESLKKSKIPMALVAAGFPVGSRTPEEISEAVASAVAKGADEIDAVLEPRADDPSFPGELEVAKLAAMREASRGTVLKVILESSLLSAEQLRAVSKMALEADADFIKSSTGKRGKCSDEAAVILAEEVQRHGGGKGVKLSGGVSTKEDAERLIALVRGRDASLMSNTRLRIGASSLVRALVSET